MSILEKVKEFYSFFEDKEIDIVQLNYDSKGFLLLSEFNKDVMEKAIDEKEIQAIVNFLQDKDDNIVSHILDILLSNSSFFQNELVKEVYHYEIEDRIYEDIDSFDLHGDKLKIIDLFYNNDIEKIKVLLATLDRESQLDILMFIMEYTYTPDVSDKNTPIGDLLSEYRELVIAIYEERDISDYGEEIEFEAED